MFTHVLERHQSVTNPDDLMTTGDVAAHLLGIDPARMLASSTSTFITNDKIKTDLIFFFFSVLQ